MTELIQNVSASLFLTDTERENDEEIKGKRRVLAEKKNVNKS